MNKKYYESNEFKAIQDEWYSKLKEAGFKDIENRDLNEYTVTSEVLTPPAVSDKIQKLLQILAEKNSELRERDIQILTMYCDSKSVTEIAAAIGIKHQSVSERIRTLMSKYY